MSWFQSIFGCHKAARTLTARHMIPLACTLKAVQPCGLMSAAFQRVLEAADVHGGAKLCALTSFAYIWSSMGCISRGRTAWRSEIVLRVIYFVPCGIAKHLFSKLLSFADDRRRHWRLAEATFKKQRGSSLVDRELGDWALRGNSMLIGRARTRSLG